MPEFAGPPPDEVIGELKRMKEHGEHQALTMLLGRLRDDGYKAVILADIAELSANAFYSRMRTYKRVMAGERPAGYREYGPELTAESIHSLQTFVTIGWDIDTKRDDPIAADMLLTVKIGAQEWVGERLCRAVQQGVTATTLAEYVGKTPQWVGKVMSEYRLKFG